MSNYVTIQLVSRFLQGASEADSEALNLSIQAASRFIDNLCEVNENFFAVAESVASEKTLSGAETSLLRLPPYLPGTLTIIETEDVEFDIADFRQSGKPPVQFLIAPQGIYFSDTEEYILTAKWGFAAIPADISQATVAMTIKMFRDTDAATVKMADTETVISQNVPPFVRDICEQYRKMNLFFANI